MLSINTDLSNLLLQSTLSRTTFDLNEAITQMTTGYKVNHAKDNAANYSIITDLSKRISSMLQVQQNTEDGLSLLQTAEGGLEEVNTLLARLRELATQASNGSYDAKSRTKLQEEANSIIKEINRIKNTVEYDGMSLYYSKEVEPYMEKITSILNSVAPASMPVSLSSIPAPVSSGVIEGTVELQSGEEKTIVIDGVNYTVKNDNTTNTLEYSKDLSSGVLTFTCDKMTITAQNDVSHNITIYGSNNKIYTGDCDDKIIVDSATNVTAAEVYSKGGNDEIICNQKPRVISSGSGDDKVVFSCRTNGGGYTSTIFDEEGNDHYIFSGAERSNYTVQGGAGINVFEINSDSQYITFDTAKTNAHKNTFYIKGDFNNVSCSNSTVENLVVMLGNNNRYSGTARYYVNGAGTTGNNISGSMAPNYGTLVGGASRPVIIGGASFQFSANSSSSIAAADRKLTYFFNPFNNSIEIIGEGYQVTNNNTYGFGDHDLILQGNEMIFISMISKYNSFTLEDGENNIIQFIGNSEDNKIKIKSDNNQIHVSQGIINANLELTGSNNIFNLTHTAFFKTANVYGESNTFNLNSQRGSTINLYGDRNTVTDAATTVAQNASHTVIINSSYNTVDLRPGANQFNPPCDYCSINGNFNNVSISRNKGDLNVIGNNNVVKNGVLTASNGAADMSYAINLEGNNNIVEAELAANLNFNGSNNTFTSYGDLLNLGINGNENSIELKGLAIRSSTNSNIIGNTNTLIDNYGNNITNIVGNNNTLTGGIDVDVYKVKGDGNNLTGGDNDDAFIINSGLGNTINGNNSASANIMINNGKNTNYSNVKDCTLNGFGLDVKVGIGSADSAIIHEEISLNTLGIDVDLSNQESARASLEKIDEMINSLSEQILSIGASINRLEMVLEEQSIKLDNMISSRSTLQDADIAEVSSNFIKSQILQQSSVTLMASTKNLRQGSILGLLQRL